MERLHIFICLKRVIPTLSPLNMNVATINENMDSAKALSENDRKRLTFQLERDEYSEFHDVISYMLEHDVKFEQENWS